MLVCRLQHIQCNQNRQLNRTPKTNGAINLNMKQSFRVKYENTLIVNVLDPAYPEDAYCTRISLTKDRTFIFFLVLMSTVYLVSP